MPEELAGKDVEIEVVPGYEVVPELAPPESLDELLANEPRQTVIRASWCCSSSVPSQGIAYRGHVTQRLPPFTLDALRPQTSDDGPEAFQSWSRTVVPLDWYVEGKRQGEGEGPQRRSLSDSSRWGRANRDACRDRDMTPHRGRPVSRWTHAKARKLDTSRSSSEATSRFAVARSEIVLRLIDCSLTRVVDRS